MVVAEDVWQLLIDKELQIAQMKRIKTEKFKGTSAQFVQMVCKLESESVQIWMLASS
jgi:hypothetical protein